MANGDVRVAEGAETRRYNASINLNYIVFDGSGRYYNYKRLKELMENGNLPKLDNFDIDETKFIESMSKLSSIGDLSIVNKLTTLSDISNTLNLENVNKLKTFTSEVVDAINSFSGIQDPAVEALSAITSELYMLCDVIEKLDVDKLGGLQNINLGGVQTPIKIPARKSEQQIIEGTIGPKLMMTEWPIYLWLM